MVQYTVLQNKWLMVAMFGGFALVLVTVLGYMALWRRRQPETEGAATFAQWLRSYAPYVLIVSYVAAALFSIIYVLMRAAHPPNW